MCEVATKFFFDFCQNNINLSKHFPNIQQFRTFAKGASIEAESNTIDYAPSLSSKCQRVEQKGNKNTNLEIFKLKIKYRFPKFIFRIKK